MMEAFDSTYGVNDNDSSDDASTELNHEELRAEGNIINKYQNGELKV